jgi:hypothetical protein
MGDGDFVCPAVKIDTCSGTFSPSPTSWPLVADEERIHGTASSTSSNIPYANRAVRRSSLDPCELVPAFDEVWSDGICLHDAWQWRPFFDVFHTLMGAEFLNRVYVLERGGPLANYKRVECDLKSFTNDYRSDSFWERELAAAKRGEYVQIIDNSGYFCEASDEAAATQFRWQNTAQESADLGPSGQCQLYPGARYTINHYDDFGGIEAPTVSSSGQYIFSPSGPGDGARYSEFVHVHELTHLAQNAARGRRLYMENGWDGECCTVWFEHVSFVTYSGYVERLPQRFPGLELVAPWNGWRIDEQMENAGGFGEGKLYPSWMKLTYPDPTGADAQEQKWSTATFVQSAYRLYTVFKDGDGNYINHLLSCFEDTGCGKYEDPGGTFAALPAELQVHYSADNYQIVMDFTYRLRNLATQYFVHLADQEHADGFGAFEFFTYELENHRDPFGPDLGTTSDTEMFGLAGFTSGRREFLEAFQVWMVGNLDGERSPLQVAEEITQPQADLLADIARFKERNLVVDDDGDLPRCADESLPVIDLSGGDNGIDPVE